MGLIRKTHVFDVGTWMDSDDVAMLNAEVVSDYTIYAGGTIIKIIICQNDENSVLSFLALHQDCVTAEKL